MKVGARVAVKADAAVAAEEAAAEEAAAMKPRAAISSMRRPRVRNFPRPRPMTQARIQKTAMSRRTAEAIPDAMAAGITTSVHRAAIAIPIARTIARRRARNSVPQPHRKQPLAIPQKRAS